MQDIGLITCRTLPEPDPDAALLSNALEAAGLSAGFLAWDDPSDRPSDYRVCVFRSCWNYFEATDAFLAWVQAADGASTLTNPAAAVRWNVDKRYLSALDAAGVPVVPTLFLRRTEPVDLVGLLDGRDWDDIVVKPAVSAASFRTRRFGPGETGRAQRFLDALVGDGDVMVQPYFRSVESSEGERSVIGVDGAWTHAVRKAPRFEGDDEHVSEGLAVTGEEIAIAEACLGVVPGDVFYARLDLMRDIGGRLRVSEVEVIEPSLYLAQSPAAMERYVAGLARMARSG